MPHAVVLVLPWVGIEVSDRTLRISDFGSDMALCFLAGVIFVAGEPIGLGVGLIVFVLIRVIRRKGTTS